MAYTKIDNANILTSLLIDGDTLDLSMTGENAPRVLASVGDGYDLNSFTVITKIESFTNEDNEYAGVGIIIKDNSDNHFFAGFHSWGYSTLYARALGNTWDTYSGYGWYSNYGSLTNSIPSWLKVTLNATTGAYTISSSSDGVSWEIDCSGTYSTIITILADLKDIGLGIHTLLGIESDDEFAASFSNVTFDFDPNEKLRAAPGSYLLTGSPINLWENRINAAPGSYLLTGFSVMREDVLEASAGSYTLTGFSADLYIPRSIEPAPGVYALTGSTASLRQNRIDAVSGSFVLTGSPISFKIGPANEPTGAIRYYFTLTGDADGKDDVEIPISSFQARKRSGVQTYLSVVIPGLDYTYDITDRPNGDMKIDVAYVRVGVELSRKTILIVNLEDVRIDQGSTNISITLTGHKQITYNSKSIELSGYTYKSVTNGSSVYRFAKPDLFLNAGDTVTIGEDTITANVISYFAAAKPGGIETSMEISESM